MCSAVRFSNAITGGHVAVRLAMREQVIGRIESIAPVLVAADIAALGIVVEVTPGGEVCRTTGSTNACKIMVVKLDVPLVRLPESGGFACPVLHSSNRRVSAEAWFAGSLTRLPAEKEPTSSRKTIYSLLILSNVQLLESLVQL
jgi:hypothetical protein